MKRPNDDRPRRRWLAVLPLPLMVVVGAAAGSHFDPGPWNISPAGWLQFLCVSLAMTIITRWNPGSRHNAIHARRPMRRYSQVYQSRGGDQFK